jgi:Transposase IS4
MDEEEFASDEVWFGDQFRWSQSQGLVLVEDTQPVDEIAEEAGPGDASTSPIACTKNDAGNLEIPTEEQDQQVEQDLQESVSPDDIEDPEELNLKPRAKRNTISYAKKMLLANLELFLDSTLYGDKYTDTSIEIVGQVKECPRASNGKMYRIDWKGPLPPGLDRSWLRIHVAGTNANKAKLQLAIKAYEEKKPTATHTKKMTATEPTTQAPIGIEVETTSKERVGATASVRTSSTMSSLSRSSVASPEVSRLPRTSNLRKTRSTAELESSSDDGDDLDESDNIYAEYSLSEDSDAEDTDEDDDANTSGASGSDNVGLTDLLDDIQWSFEAVDADLADTDAPFPYMGPSGLKPRVSESFSNPFECLSVCGGIDYEFVCRLARNSNEYARRHLLHSDRNNRLHGLLFTNITTEEMYHFLGITLRISLSPIDSGGYEAYFSRKNKIICGLQIGHSDGFARHYMTLGRYKQIRSAFHPEDRASGDGGDKCYQLRHAINTLNQAAYNTKFMAENVTFDEGGIGSRHRMNPVRQFNKDKPQKFRVDFFIMACSKTYFIHHLDVYQGKNAANVNIDRSVRNLPTTMKAVLNAVLSTKMHTETNGARHIALDNRYQCPELAFLLRQKFKILSSGTCRQNRKGWDKELMNLNKKDGRGKYKLTVDKDNRVMCAQWVDSKVVNCVSSILSSEIQEVHRQVGSKKMKFPCPFILVRYQKTMQGVDKNDQMRAAGGGFALKAHYQKWYKRAYFAILDMMTLNALIAWNISVQTSTRRNNRVPLKRHEFLWYIAESMLTFKDTRQQSAAFVDAAGVTVVTKDTDITLDGHAPVPCSDHNAKCAVCRLDWNIKRLARMGRDDWGYRAKSELHVSKRGIASKLSICTKCRITAHPTVPPNQRKIHSIADFKDLTCFQIAHTQAGCEVWKRTSDAGRAYMPQMKHTICNRLRELHGLDPLSARKKKRKRDDYSNNDDDSSRSED